MIDLTQTDYAYVARWPRVKAAALDFVIIILFSLVVLCVIVYQNPPAFLLLLSGEFDPSNQHEAEMLILMISLGVWAVLGLGFSLGYDILSIYFNQATLGQIMIKAKVIDANTGGRPTLRQCLIRTFAKTLAQVDRSNRAFAGLNEKYQTYQDMMADVLVVSYKCAHK